MTDENPQPTPEEPQSEPDQPAAEAEAPLDTPEASDAASEATTDDAAAMAAQLAEQADAVAEDAATAGGAAPGGEPLDLPRFAPGEGGGVPSELDLLSDVNLHVKIELGRTQMLVEDVLQLRDGAVVELDKLAGDPVDIYVNERHIAKGEVLVLNDTFCVRINEILNPDDRMVG